MPTAPTHRLLFHEGHGFLSKRELTPEDERDVDGWPVWAERDEALLADVAMRLSVSLTKLHDDIELLEVIFVPKAGFEATVLEALTDDETVCPAGTYAAFEPVR